MKIVALGDSITYGYPYLPEQSWFNMAAKKLNVAYINCGVNSDTTAGMLRSFEQAVAAENPSHVIIMGGTNDVYGAERPETIVANIEKLIRLVQQCDAAPILGIPIPCNDHHEEAILSLCRDGLKQLAAKMTIPSIDFHAALVDSSGMRIKEEYHIDGLHPNEAGYQLMGVIATEALTRLLCEKVVAKSPES